MNSKLLKHEPHKERLVVNDTWSCARTTAIILSNSSHISNRACFLFFSFGPEDMAHGLLLLTQARQVDMGLPFTILTSSAQNPHIPTTTLKTLAKEPYKTTHIHGWFLKTLDFRDYESHSTLSPSSQSITNSILVFEDLCFLFVSCENSWKSIRFSSLLSGSRALRWTRKLSITFFLFITFELGICMCAYICTYI